MAKVKLERILVIDIEATCWEDEKPLDQESEIIEIGVCPLDLSTLQRIEKRSILVRPEKSTVSEFCTQLTTLTQEQVDGGISFVEACQLLRKEYRAHECVWASYGEYDRRMFETQCRLRNVAYPFQIRHINVKTLFALFQGLKHEVGMHGALQQLGIDLEGTHHRGHDDAWNIAGILAEMLKFYRNHAFSDITGGV